MVPVSSVARISQWGRGVDRGSGWFLLPKAIESLGVEPPVL